MIEAMEAAYHAKAYSISIPTLVIHGQWDESAPLRDAVDMHNKIQTDESIWKSFQAPATTI